MLYLLHIPYPPYINIPDEELSADWDFHDWVAYIRNFPEPLPDDWEPTKGI